MRPGTEFEVKNEPAKMLVVMVGFWLTNLNSTLRMFLLEVLKCRGCLFLMSWLKRNSQHERFNKCRHDGATTGKPKGLLLIYHMGTGSTICQS